MTHSTGLRTEYDWFPNAQDRRLKRIRHLKPGGSLAIAVMDYTYDAAGRLLTWKQEEDADAARAQLWTFQYDQADQLTNAVTGRGAQIVNRQSWAYDGAGNRINDTANGASRGAAYNSLNQLVSTDSELGTATYQWDAENRLVAFEKGTARTEFGYDGLGRRVRLTEMQDGKTVSAQTYLWDGYTIREGRDAAGTAVQRRFLSGGFIENMAGRASGFLQTADHLGSIRETLDVSGNLKERISYDPWGNASSSATVPVSTFGFTGHLWHRRSGLHLAPLRAYAPPTGRWISRDPIGEMGGENLYAYLFNAPVDGIDPLGLYPVFGLSRRPLPKPASEGIGGPLILPEAWATRQMCRTYTDSAGTFGLWHGFVNHFGGGPMDFKVKCPEGALVKTPFGVMSCSQFGNFLAGITAHNTGFIGTAGVLAGGVAYDILDNLWPFGNPAESMWDFDADSRPDIWAGNNAASQIGCGCANR